MRTGKRLVFGLLITLFLSAIAFFAAPVLDTVLTEKTMSGLSPPSPQECIDRISTKESCRTMWLLLEGVSIALGILFVITSNDKMKTQTVKITDKITIPAASGEGQHGSARFMTHKEMHKKMNSYSIDRSNKLIESLLDYGDELYAQANKYVKGSTTVSAADRLNDFLFSLKHSRALSFFFRNPIAKAFMRMRDAQYDKNLSKHQSKTLKAANKAVKNYLPAGGMVIGYEKAGGRETYYYLSDDTHIMVLGSTGAGKSRRMVIQSIMTIALAGESIVVTDPKGELYAYTHKTLEKLGYKVSVLDFENPNLSSCYNPLQPIINAVNVGNISKAQSCAWDLTSFLVQKSDHGEPIWTNGEMSVMAAAIMCVVYDNRTKPQFQNLTNVYWFMSEMCRDIKMGMTTFKPIVEYVKALPDEHPAKPLLGISSVAPSKTAGSFYTSALTTLRLFIADEIYGMTYKSDLELADIGKQKSALFFILPDQKTTYYPVVTLVVSQIYNELVEYAKTVGNTLPLRVNFMLDEFGNFAKIQDFQTLMTVARGYGMRLFLFLQDFNQLTDKYGREISGTIRGNCKTWVWLSSSEQDTRELFSKRLGQYTTSGSSYGSSSQRRSDASKSVNTSLIGRDLLTASEIGMIDKPYLLVSTSQEIPAILTLPDLSKCIYNKMLGLGDEEHNKGFIMQSQAERAMTAEKRPALALWGIWQKFQPLNFGGGN